MCATFLKEHPETAADIDKRLREMLLDTAPAAAEELPDNVESIESARRSQLRRSTSRRKHGAAPAGPP